MNALAVIVEGDGEVRAVPVLLRRLAEWLSPEHHARVLPPIRVRRDRFLNKEQEFRRHLLLAAAKCGETGWILVLLDADDDCPAELASSILQRAQAVLPHRRLSVVLANREYEAWFIAAAPSLHGQRGFQWTNENITEAEQKRNAKKWLAQHMTGGYHEIADQTAFSARLDLSLAHKNSRSFRKLCSEWQKQINHQQGTSL